MKTETKNFKSFFRPLVSPHKSLKSLFLAFVVVTGILATVALLPQPKNSKGANLAGSFVFTAAAQETVPPFIPPPRSDPRDAPTRGEAGFNETMKRLGESATQIVPYFISSFEANLFPFFLPLAWLLAILFFWTYFGTSLKRNEGADKEFFMWLSSCVLLFCLLSYAGDADANEASNLGNGAGKYGDLVDYVRGVGNALAFGDPAAAPPLPGSSVDQTGSYMQKKVVEARAAFDTNYQDFVKRNFTACVEAANCPPETPIWERIFVPSADGYDPYKTMAEMNPQSWKMSDLFAWLTLSRGIMEIADLFLYVLIGILGCALRLLFPLVIAASIHKDLRQKILWNYLWSGGVIALVLPLFTQVLRYAIFMAMAAGFYAGTGTDVFKFDQTTRLVVAQGDPVYPTLIMCFLSFLLALTMFAAPFLAFKVATGQIVEGMISTVSGWFSSIASMGLGYVTAKLGAAFGAQAQTKQYETARDVANQSAAIDFLQKRMGTGANFVQALQDARTRFGLSDVSARTAAAIATLSNAAEGRKTFGDVAAQLREQTGGLDASTTKEIMSGVGAWADSTGKADLKLAVDTLKNFGDASGIDAQAFKDKWFNSPLGSVAAPFMDPKIARERLGITDPTKFMTFDQAKSIVADHEKGKQTVHNADSSGDPKLAGLRAMDGGRPLSEAEQTEQAQALMNGYNQRVTGYRNDLQQIGAPIDGKMPEAAGKVQQALGDILKGKPVDVGGLGLPSNISGALGTLQKQIPNLSGSVAAPALATKLKKEGVLPANFDFNNSATYPDVPLTPQAMEQLRFMDEQGLVPSGYLNGYAWEGVSLGSSRFSLGAAKNPIAGGIEAGVVSGAAGHAGKGLSIGQKQVAQITNDEMTRLGFTPQARLAMLGNVGRENSFSAATIFGGHSDPKNGASNIGLISWQKERHQALMSHLAQDGNVVGGQVVRSEKSLRSMVRFMDKEMRTGAWGANLAASMRDPAASTAQVSKNLSRYIGYSHEPQYNKPDPNFDVANNAKWAAKTQSIIAAPSSSGGSPQMMQARTAKAVESYSQEYGVDRAFGQAVIGQLSSESGGAPLGVKQLRGTMQSLGQIQQYYSGQGLSGNDLKAVTAGAYKMGGTLMMDKVLKGETQIDAQTQKFIPSVMLNSSQTSRSIQQQVTGGISTVGRQDPAAKAYNAKVIGDGMTNNVEKALADNKLSSELDNALRYQQSMRSVYGQAAQSKIQVATQYQADKDQIASRQFESSDWQNRAQYIASARGADFSNAVQMKSAQVQLEQNKWAANKQFQTNMEALRLTTAAELIKSVGGTAAHQLEEAFEKFNRM